MREIGSGEPSWDRFNVCPGQSGFSVPLVTFPTPNRGMPGLTPDFIWVAISRAPALFLVMRHVHAPSTELKNRGGGRERRRRRRRAFRMAVCRLGSRMICAQWTNLGSFAVPAESAA